MPITKVKHKKESKLSKLINTSDTDDEGSEHELSYYVNDRVKLMKEVLKIIKSKKIKSMAPECLKSLDIEELNSMLLEELLGISNKRLKYIFAGQHVDGDSSSSTDTEAENQPIDIISLDDISDTDDEFAFTDQNGKKESSKKTESKKKHKPFKHIKEEKGEKSKTNKHAKKRKEPPQTAETDQNKLMSVLELLELQARARAIRSQLALVESEKKKDDKTTEPDVKKEESDSDAVVIDSPKPHEIVISSSDSEDTETINQIIQSSQLSSEPQNQVKELHSASSTSSKQQETENPEPATKNPEPETDTSSNLKKPQKVKIIRQKIIPSDTNLDQPAVDTDPIPNTCNSPNEDPKENSVDIANASVSNKDVEMKESTDKIGNIPLPNTSSDAVDESVATQEERPIVQKDDDVHCISDNELDEIVINVDESEVDGMVNS